MARNTFKNLQAALRQPFRIRFGIDPSGVQTADRDYDNNYAQTWSDSGDTTSLEALRVDTDGRVRLDHQATLGCKQQAVYRASTNADLITTVFFIADRVCTIRAITEIHATAGNDASAVTLAVYKCTGTTAAASGATVMSGTFNLKGTANTLQTATLLSVNGDGTQNAGLVLAAGDRLAVVFAGVTTTLAGVNVTVSLTPGFKSTLAPYYIALNGRIITENIFLANRPMTLSAVYCAYGTAGAAAATIDITKDTSTNAPGAGTSVLSATMAADGATNAVLTPALSGTASVLALAAGDRLSVKYSATTTIAGVCVILVMTPTYSTIDIPYFNPDTSTVLVSEDMFTADRDYEVVDVSACWKTASAGSATIDFVIARTTTAPGSGTTCLTGTIDGTQAAETPLVGTIVTSRRNRYLTAGDRLCIKYGGTIGALAGVSANVTLAPR